MPAKRPAIALPEEWQSNETDLTTLVEIAKKYGLTRYLNSEKGRLDEIQKHLDERHPRSESWKKAVTDDLEWLLSTLGRVCAQQGISPRYDEADTQAIKQIGNKLCGTERLGV